jgi:hypothetical protein
VSFQPPTNSKCVTHTHTHTHHTHTHNIYTHIYIYLYTYIYALPLKKKNDHISNRASDLRKVGDEKEAEMELRKAHAAATKTQFARFDGLSAEEKLQEAMFLRDPELLASVLQEHVSVMLSRPHSLVA